jgi:anaerobic dimethyl sulfoxide reductase subunit A
VFGSERRYYLAKVKEKNIPVIVIDPRQSDTALGNEWIGVRPSSDAALAAAMAYVIWSEGLQDQHFMDTYCLGFDEAHMPSGVPYGESYETWLFGKKDGIPKTPEWAEPLTGVSAETTRRLARRYAMAKPACLMQGFGPQRTANGEQTVRAIALLTCLTGNVGKCGGSAGGEGGRLGPVYAGYPVPPNPFPGKIPCFLWTKALEQGTTLTPEADGLTGVKQLPCSVKMILNFAGNPLNQHSDINHTVELLKDADKCEFFLVSDVFMTATARFADILLPAASPLETENLALP